MTNCKLKKKLESRVSAVNETSTSRTSACCLHIPSQPLRSRGAPLRSVQEPPQRNSGQVGGRFLEKTVRRETESEAASASGKVRIRTRRYRLVRRCLEGKARMPLEFRIRWRLQC